MTHPGTPDLQEGVMPAREQDISEILQLIQPYVERSILLAKTSEQIRKELSLSYVYKTNGKIVGTANLVQYHQFLYEVRGLAVEQESQKNGFGEKLISSLVQKIKEINPKNSTRIFALTYVPLFFIKLGWEIVPKEMFPKKIFDDCSICRKKDDCSEIAVTIEV